jgi:prepilin-type N-terminal cleavage/methylation domain-containing protein/prepilin-type processing-associated H-X9-DG protein
MKRQRRGFTLMELFVVILIIGVLTAILFPVYSHRTEKSSMIACISNQKQLAMGMMMYVQDYDEHFPMTANLSASPKTLWTQAITPYVNASKKEIFICPASTRNSDFFLWKTYTPTSLYADRWEKRNYASIGLTAQLLFDKTGKEGYVKVFSIRELEEPANTVLLTDTLNSQKDRPKTAYEGGYTFDPCTAQQGDLKAPPFAANADDFSVNHAVFARHGVGDNVGLNVAFADGHVKGSRREALQEKKLVWAFRPCQVLSK